VEILLLKVSEKTVVYLAPAYRGRKSTGVQLDVWENPSQGVTPMKDLIVIILSELARYLESLVGLLAGPKTFVRTLDENTDKPLVQSFTFLGISYILYELLFASLLPTGVDFLQRTASHAIFLLVASLVNVGVLQISWRIVGGRSCFNKQFIIFLYYGSVRLLIIGTCIILALGVVKSLYSELFEPMKMTIMSGGSNKDALFKYINGVANAGTLANRVILTGISFLPVAADWIWIYIGWGAYRELHRASKRASAIAFIAFFVLSLACLPLFYFIIIVYLD
jgi:hypothetical protein